MIFYAPGIKDKKYSLPEEESGHAIRVLRLTTGDEMVLVDGMGGRYRAKIVIPHPKECIVEIIDGQKEESRPYHVHIAIAPPKSIDRFEWFVEKAVEIGIDEITPLLCEHSERKHLSAPRLQRIMIAAMKQSGKAALPKLNDLTDYNPWLEIAGKDNFYMAHCGPGDKYLLRDIYLPGRNAVIAIGPEGDFSPEEINRALQCGAKPVTLGPSRLRTETAGVVACHSISFLNLRVPEP